MPYIFGAVLFGLPFITMWGMSAEATISENTVMQNSEVKLHSMLNIFSLLFFLIIPAIIGTSLYRDYKSRMHTLLYSFPFNNHEYILGKFISSFSVVALICLGIISGLALGTLMPGVKEAALLPFDFGVHFNILFLHLLPNAFFISVLVFAVVAKTRNIYIGFISVILLIIIKAMITGLLTSSNLNFIGALLDPLGESPVNSIKENWTLEQRNHNSIPIVGIVLFNRIFWIVTSLAILYWVNKKFQFNQFVQLRRNSKTKVDSKVSPLITNQIKKIRLPKINLTFDKLQRLKTVWHLSNIDFKSVVVSWPFLCILMAGTLMVLFQQYNMNPEDGVVVIPTTANMLRVPMFMFTAVVNFLTFLYSGILMYRSKLARIDSLVDICPQPNWVFLLSKVLALFKMQLSLLALVMFAGIFAQVLNGYYKFEIAHYLFELFILNGIHFLIWTCLAISVHSFSKNMYLGFFFLLMIPMGLMFVPPVADFIGLPILKEEIFRFNSVKGQFLGFDYSVYNGYGSQLIPYFTYKFYWFTAGIGLLLFAMLTWKRGYTFTIKERINIAASRFKGAVKYSLILGFMAFIGMGFSIYYQEYNVSKVVFSEKFTNDIMAKNELQFGNYENLVHPMLSDVKLDMQFYPKTKSYKLKGSLVFVNKVEQKIDTIVIAKSFKDETIVKIKNTHQVIALDDTMHYEIIKLSTPLAKGDIFNFDFEMENYENSFLHHNSRIIENGNYILGNIMPQLGIRNIFIKNKKKRKEYNLPERTFKEMTPQDTSLLGYKNASNNMGRINYECLVSTSENQKAFTMGTLVKNWKENGRNYFLYKSQKPIVNTISWMSGDYIKNTSSSNFAELEMYRHKDNNRNDKHMFEGTVASLDYCSSIFGKLDYDTIKMVEFPITFGTYATVNGNLVPFSETYLQCDVHNHNNKVFNVPYFVAAHETAHHWWGHRVDPANVKGSRVITEGMADYLAFKIIEKEYGYEKAFGIRKKMFDLYIEYRAELANETPLIYSTIENEYLNYRKASMALYSMSAYLGEETFNNIVSKFETQNRYKEAPFVTSLDFVQAFKTECPDSLQYLISDFFEDITLYDNEIKEVKTNLKNKIYNTEISFNIIKYNADSKGKRIFNTKTIEENGMKSLALADYIDITLFNKKGEIISSQRTLVTAIENKLVFETDQEVSKIEIDDKLLLIDINRDNNVWEK